MKKILLKLALLGATLFAYNAANAQTVAVTADLKTMFNAGAATKTQICFSLTDGNGNQISNPRTSSGVIVPTATQCVSPDGAGHISTTVIANDQITPSNSIYSVTYTFNGRVVHGDIFQFALADGTENLNTKTSLSTVPVVSTPTGDTTYARLDGGNSPFTGNETFNGSVSVKGTLQACNTINGVHWVCDLTSGADLGAKINTAASNGGVVAISPGMVATSISTALSLPAGTSLYFPPGTFSMVGGHTIAHNGVSLLGSGIGATILVPTSATGDFITITGNNFNIGGLDALPSVTRTSGAFMNIQGAEGVIHDIVVHDMWDGFIQQGPLTGQNVFDHIIAEGGGGNWHNVFRNGPLSSGTIPATTIHNFTIALSSGGSTISGALFVLDSGTDSIKIDGLEISRITGSDTNPAFLMQSTGAAQVPSYVVMTNSYCETNNLAPCVEIDNAALPDFSNLGIALGITGMKIAGGKGIKVSNSFFNDSQQGAVQITGGSDIVFTGNTINDSAAAAANTYDAISVAAGVSKFNITNNRIGNWLFGGNTFRNGISVAAGASDNYVITGNVIDGVGTSTISDGGTGLKKQVQDITASVQSFSPAFTMNISGASAFGSFGLHDTTPAAPTPNKFFRISGGSLNIINSAFGAVIFALDDSGNESGINSLQTAQYKTTTNCAAVGTAASPSVAACGSAAAGQFSCATNATGATCQVNTTAVSANSEIFVFESDTAVTGTRLGVTCNTGTTVNPATRLLASSVAGASFTINLGTVTTNPACFSYHIVN